jgi:hypothetical protein
MRPERARESIPNISFIKFNLIPFQKCAELGLKRKPFMMLALVANVSTNFFNRRLAHRKCAVAALSIKIRELFIARPQPIIGAFS